jgi:hypothetical protein
MSVLLGPNPIGISSIPNFQGHLYGFGSKKADLISPKNGESRPNQEPSNRECTEFGTLELECDLYFSRGLGLDLW